MEHLQALAALPRHESYKDSGVDWIGAIPEGWGLTRLKYILTIRNGSDYKAVQSVEGYPVYGSGGPFAYASTFMFDGEAILLGRKGTIDKPLYVIGKFWTVDTMFYCIPNLTCSGRYLYYLSLTLPLKALSTSTALPSVTQEDLKALPIPLPPLPEQRAIAAFLDEKTALIDRLIAQKERMLSLLKERRQIVIQQAVTRGLDPNVKLKPSGVDWLGDVPEGWEVKRLKYVFQHIQTGTTPPSSNQDFYGNEINWFNPSDLNNPELINSEKKLSRLAIERQQVKEFLGDSILVVGIGATSGKTAFMSTTGTYNQQITGFRSKTEFNRFYFHVFASFSSTLLALANFTTLPILNNEFFKSLCFPCPPFNEQVKIAKYIDDVTSRFESMISKISAEVLQLQEYREVLIDSAVRGKVRVHRN